jgi:hypothetical protein
MLLLLGRFQLLLFLTDVVQSTVPVPRRVTAAVSTVTVVSPVTTVVRDVKVNSVLVTL